MSAIEANDVVAHRDGASVLSVTLSLGPGRHALLGRREDGPGALLACFAGDLRPKRGSLKVLGASPSSPATRARIGWIPLEIRLPDALRVDETLELARRIRKEKPIAPSAVLERLGIDSLARRRVDSLDAGEARAVALAEALSSPTVSVILIEEPLVAMAPPAVSALPSALIARDDACIVIATASAFDATRVANHFALFDRGRLVRVANEAPLRTGRERPRIRVVAPDVRVLASALANRPEIEHLELDARSVVVDGPDASALAAAVNVAILETASAVQSIEPEPAPLEELQKAVS